MRVLAMENGWSVAPHCWWRFLLMPLHCRHYVGRVYTVGVWGFVWWIEFA